jgi:hypothetical protein
MMNEEEFENTTKLIDECYKNVRMGSFAIDCIMPAIEENEDLCDLLRKQNKCYLKSVNELEKLSEELSHEIVDINPMLKGSSFASIKMKTAFNKEAPHLAEMLIQGTTMGITQLIKSHGEAPSSNDKLDKIVKDIIKYEEEFVDSLKLFLQ